MSVVVSAIVAALPIREQPTFPPETGPEPVELAFLGAVVLGLVLLVAVSAAGRRRAAPLSPAEVRARAAMDELCPDGWTAELTLYGSPADLPEGAPDIPGIQVRLDWAELRETGGAREVVVARRLWSRSIAEALRGMVDDRRLDLQLERIERASERER